MKDILNYKLFVKLYGLIVELYGLAFYLITAWRLLVVQSDPCSFLGWFFLIGPPLSLLAGLIWPFSLYVFGLGLM